jgi:hypothetical protein
MAHPVGRPDADKCHAGHRTPPPCKRDPPRIPPGPHGTRLLRPAASGTSLGCRARHHRRSPAGTLALSSRRRTSRHSPPPLRLASGRSHRGRPGTRHRRDRPQQLGSGARHPASILRESGGSVQEPLRIFSRHAPAALASWRVRPSARAASYFCPSPARGMTRCITSRLQDVSSSYIPQRTSRAHSAVASASSKSSLRTSLTSPTSLHAVSHSNARTTPARYPYTRSLSPFLDVPAAYQGSQRTRLAERGLTPRWAGGGRRCRPGPGADRPRRSARCR